MLAQYRMRKSIGGAVTKSGEENERQSDQEYRSLIRRFSNLPSWVAKFVLLFIRLVTSR